MNRRRMKSDRCLQSDNVKLRPQQVSVAKFLQTHRGLLAVHSTGTGKTITAAAAAACLVASGAVKHVVVLAKKSAVAQFEAEVKRFWGIETNGILVCTTHQQFFGKLLATVDAAHTFLVVDEAHEFTNPKAVGTKRLLEFAQACHR